MRLLILHLATVFGGAERTTSNLISHLDRQVVRHVTVAAPETLRGLLPQTMDAFVDTSRSIRHGWFVSAQALMADAKAVGNIIRETAPDLVLGMMHYPAALAVLGAKLGRLPVKVVGSYRGPAYEHLRRYESGLQRRLFLWLAVAATARLADRIIVPSRGTADELAQRFLGPKRRIVAIPNGIDLELAQRHANARAVGLDGLPEDLPKLCVAARLSVEKDVGLLLAAFRRVQERQPASLVVVGGGPDLPALERLVIDYGLEHRVAFVGHQANVYPYMRAADIYVHTCQFEGFGYAMLEAMACGTPVIATDCPYGPREVIADNAYGILVPAENPGALASAVAELLGNPQRRAELTAAGLERARHLTVARMVRRYEDVFRELVRCN